MKNQIEHRIEHIIKYEKYVKSFVEETFNSEKVFKNIFQKQTKSKNLFPLKNILFGVKDVINVDGYPTKCGSDLPHKLFDGEQATCVSRLLKAGATFTGKTVTAEFAISDPGETRNPRNLEHTPGGSSSGSAASVAAGFCDIAIGTQTCGSVIRPAGYCGVVGYKPSFGRIDKDGVIPFSPSIDHVGLLAKDLTVLEEVAPFVVNGWNTETRLKGEKLIIGIPDGSYISLAKKEVADQYFECVRKLEDSFILKKIKLVQNITKHNQDLDQIILAELYRVHSKWFHKYKELYKPLSRESIEIGKTISEQKLGELLDEAQKFHFEMISLIQEHHISAWITPVAPYLAPKGLQNTGDFSMNSIWTYSGLPVITIPTGVNQINLPFAIQIVGQFGKDEELLYLSKFIEKIIGAKELLNQWNLNNNK